MKTVSVRIREDQAQQLHEVTELGIGSSRDKIVQMALDLWLEVEAPVYLAALRGAREKLRRKRQPVTAEEVAR